MELEFSEFILILNINIRPFVFLTFDSSTFWLFVFLCLEFYNFQLCWSRPFGIGPWNFLLPAMQLPIIRPFDYSTFWLLNFQLCWSRSFGIRPFDSWTFWPFDFIIKKALPGPKELFLLNYWFNNQLLFTILKLKHYNVICNRYLGVNFSCILVCRFSNQKISM